MPFRPSAISLAARGSPSSRRWLARQFKDPLVKQRLTESERVRARSAYKLIDLENARHFLNKPDVHTVVDLGAAPGGWSQVVSAAMGWTAQDVAGLDRVTNVWEAEKEMSTLSGRDGKLEEAEYKAMGSFGRKADASYDAWSVDSDPLDALGLDAPTPSEAQIPQEVAQEGHGTIIAVDLLPIYPMPGVKTLQMDFLAPETTNYIKALIPAASEGKVDVILSDMAANFTGNRIHDVQSSLDICKAVFRFAQKHLRTAASIGRTRGGVLV